MMINKIILLAILAIVLLSGVLAFESRLSSQIVKLQLRLRMFSNIIWYIIVFAVIGFSVFWILFSLRDKSKRTERNGVFCTLIIIYSVFFWYFFHPFWTEKWLDIFETGGLYLRTSNFICGLIYIGGFVIKVKLWNRLYPFD